MRPQDIMKLIQSQIKRITGQDSATKYFEQQQEALASIKNTSGMKEIQDYFYRAYDDSCTQLGTIDAKDTHKVAYHQAQMNVAKSFLSRLDNVTT